MIVFQDLTLTELTELLTPQSGPADQAPRRARMRARQLFQWVYQRHVLEWEQMTDLSNDLRAWLAQNVSIYRPEVATNHQALDGTQKFLWRLHDGKTIESVVIPAALQADEALATESDLDSDSTGSIQSRPTPSAFAGARIDAERAPLASSWKRLTLCISSQVGCAMACKFCLTGVQGLDRHLRTHEIVAQVLEIRRLAPITNIVFMGMGEPLHNLEAVIRACQILIEPYGLAFSKRKVTVSTSGIVPAIAELGSRVNVSLAISLNGSTDAQRTQIMPVNKRWPIAELLAGCRAYPLGGHRRITFEYVLLEGVNDSIEDARRVARLLRGIPSKVNLIPFNEHPGSEFKRPADAQVRKFQKVLLDAGYTATVRISRGRDILAACGQLRSVFGTARGSERHRDWATPLGVMESSVPQALI